MSTQMLEARIRLESEAASRFLKLSDLQHCWQDREVLTAELTKLVGRLPETDSDPLNCKVCWRRAPGTPDHFGSTRCRSNSLASGGSKPHCTCDTCY